MDDLRNGIYDVVRTIASHKDAEWVRDRLLAAGWTKPPVAAPELDFSSWGDAQTIGEIGTARSQQPPSEPAPLKMLVDADWLRKKIAADSDMDCEVGLTEDEAAERADPDRTGGRLYYDRRLHAWREQRDEAAPAIQEQELLAGGWLPIVLCPTDGEWRLCKLPDGSEVVASFQGQDLGPFVRRWRVREFGYHNPAHPTGEIFGGVERIAPAYDTAVIKDLPEGVYPIYFRPNDTVYGRAALRTQGGK